MSSKLSYVYYCSMLFFTDSINFSCIEDDHGITESSICVAGECIGCVEKLNYLSRFITLVTSFLTYVPSSSGYSCSVYSLSFISWLIWEARSRLSERGISFDSSLAFNWVVSCSASDETSLIYWSFLFSFFSGLSKLDVILSFFGDGGYDLRTWYGETFALYCGVMSVWVPDRSLTSGIVLLLYTR